MSFTRKVVEEADKYDLNYYDEPSDDPAAGGSIGARVRPILDTDEPEVAARQSRRFQESRGYSRPQYGDQYQERDVYTQASTMQRSRPAYAPATTVTGYDPHTATWMQRVNNPIFHGAVAEQVGKILHRDVIESELDTLRNYVLTVNPKMFVGWSDARIIPVIAKGFISAIHHTKNQPYFTDVHEILKHEIKETGQEDQARTTYDRINQKLKRMDPRTALVHVGSILGHQSPYDILNLFNPQALISQQQVELDSRYRNVDGRLDNKTYTWGVLYDVQRALGRVNIVGSKVTDIVGFEVFPMRIPTPRVTTPGGYKQYRLLVKQWGTQAFAGPNGKPYHCVFRPTADGADYVDLEPVGDRDQGGGFSFDKKITRLDEISISLTDPINDVEFWADRFICTISTYGVGTSFTSTDPLPNLINGDLVTFEGMRTTDSALDQDIVQAVNSQQYAITVTGANTFDIAGLDTTVIPLARRVAGMGMTCYVDKRRFFIYMKIKYKPGESSDP